MTVTGAGVASADVHVARDDTVAEIVLSAADGNRLDTRAIAALADALAKLGSDPEVRSIVQRGEGRSFCHGRRGTSGLRSEETIGRDLEPVIQVGRVLRSIGCVVVSAVEGSALGFGMGLALQSHLVVAAKDAEFALPEMSHGIPPLIVLAPLAARVGVARAVELALTGRKVEAHEAVQLGIVSVVVRPGEAVVRARRLARAVADVDQDARRLLLSFATELWAHSTDDAAERGVRRIAEFLATREAGVTGPRLR